MTSGAATSWRICIAAGVAISAGPGHAVEPCVPSEYFRWTNDFYYSASSTSGAQGEVVGVDVYLTVESLHVELAFLNLVVCYDDEQAELLGEPVFSPQMGELAYVTHFFPLGREPAPRRPDGGLGLFVDAGMRENEGQVARFLSRPEPFHLMTIFFRVKGSAGSAFEVRFCDNEFRFDLEDSLCLENHLYYIPSFEGQLLAGSDRHAAGAVRITESNATRAGDVNRDSRLDVSDAILLLHDLFLGADVPCPGASDFNADGRVDIADPVSILDHLFRGGPASPAGEVDCVKPGA